MSAVIVLILRSIMTIVLYVFLLTALFFFLKEMRQSIRLKEHYFLSKISLQTEEGQIRSFSQPEIFIGRDSLNDLQLKDETISTRHAQIYYQGNHWMIEDLQSTNGTYLNDERIYLPATLLANDIIRCGKVKIQFSLQK